jgi:hypothetical protein
MTEPHDTLPAIPGRHRDAPQEWDDDTLADLKADTTTPEPEPEPETEPTTVAYPLTQSAWDRRQVHQLRQVEAVTGYWRANWNRPDAILATRSAVILRAEPGADDAERLHGVRTDPASAQAYLAEPLPEGAGRKALPAGTKRSRLRADGSDAPQRKPPRKRATAPRKRATAPARSSKDGEKGT